jgi:sRNA-binding regulator protein Hfq
MPRPARQPRESRAARAPGPATKGQLDQIHNLARRMGLAEAEVEERVGAPLNSLDHLSARGAISKLRQQLEESGTWQPRVGEGTDQEGAYLGKLRDCGVELVAHLINGQRVEGTIVDFTPYTVRLRGGDGDEVTVRKLAIAYYQTKGPVDDAQ